MAYDKISIYCPFCKRHTSVEPLVKNVKILDENWRVPLIYVDKYEDNWWIGSCNYCEEVMLIKNAGVTIYPASMPSPTDKSVPENIRADMDEAKRCMGASAWRGAAVLSRRAMQSAAVDKGANNDKLAQQITDLFTAGEITRELKEWADVVRWVGNDAAHPNSQSVEAEDAEEVIGLAEEFLNALYVTPSKAAKLKKRRGR